MQSSIWRKLPTLRNSLPPPFQFSRFHSTPISLAKSSSKSNHKDQGRGQKPSKAQMRFAVRQRRADAKKAIKDFLLFGKPSKYLEDDDLNWRSDETRGQNAKFKNSSPNSDNFSRSKGYGNSEPHTSSYTGKGKNSGRKSWHHKQPCYTVDVDDIPDSNFEAIFGGQRCYTWSFTWIEKLDFNNSTTGFDWRDETRSERSQKRVWSESDDEDEPTNIGSHSQRVILGLPLTGPLNLNDVKCAFRASALRWHPDKHQGPKQAMAEEKFKVCVNAYKSLCSALKPA